MLITDRFLVAALCLVFAACGGGGGGGQPPPATTFYVRAGGNDAADGLSAATAFKTIGKGIVLLGPGDTLVVGPGVYAETLDITGLPGTASQPVTLLADASGAQTGDRAGAVRIDADEAIYGLRISQSPYVVIDGFQFERARGDNATAIQVRSESANAVIRNCVFTNNADAIRIVNSNDVLLFNNLIIGNSNRGIRIADGAVGARIINNTIVDNRNRGVAIGGTNEAGVACTGATLRNNIIQDNNNVSISIDDGPPTSLTGYTGNYNLVYFGELADQTKTYRPTTIIGDNDVNENARFTAAAGGDFSLDQGASPAVDAGTGSIGDTLLSALFDRSTAPDGAPDRPPVDLGYHAPAR